jgi:peptidoglycan/LPS O-acetylase OafA/YrhL
MKPRDLPALTIVRFFAALVVALSHYAVFGLRESPLWVRHIVASGYMGVPFFFILSGFVLVYATGGAPLDRRQFWVRRVARICPIYLLAWGLYGLLIVGLRGWNLSTLEFSAVYGGLSAALLQSWVPGAAERWNAPGWSLSCEAFFYLSFPLLFARFGKARLPLLWCTLAASALWCVLRIEAVSALRSQPMLEGTAFRTSAGLYVEQLPAAALGLFLVGVTIGHLYLRGVRPAARLWLPLFALVLWLMAADPGSAWAGLPRDAWITLAFALLIWALAEVNVKEGPLKSCGLLLGQASYGLYIMQFPLWGLLWLAVDGGDGRDEKSLAVALAFIVGLTATCCLGYLYFERPMERLVKRWLASKPPTGAVEAASVRNAELHGASRPAPP